MKTLMMIGGSERHRDLLASFREEHKCYIVCIDKDENAPAKEYADVFVPISVTDTMRALEFARGLEIDGCIAIPDIGAKTGAFINTQLNLKGIKYNTYLCMTDKKISRRAFESAGVALPREFTDHSPDYTDIESFIIKPVNSTGSSGVYKMSKNDLYRKLPPFYQKDYVIEEYLDGNMFSVDLVMQDGKIRYGMVHDRYLGYPDCFVDAIIFSPSNYGYNDDTQILFPICEKALASVRFTDGPANLQFIEKGGIFYLIEVNPRISGPYGIECHTLATHVDWFYDIAMAALGETVLNATLHPCNIKPNALVTIGAEKDGVISHVTYPEWLGKVDGYWRWKEDGDQVNKMKAVKDSIEHIFIMDNNILMTLDKAFSLLKETKVHLR